MPFFLRTTERRSADSRILRGRTYYGTLFRKIRAQSKERRSVVRKKLKSITYEEIIFSLSVPPQLLRFSQ